jgi:hypothetical protein
VSTVFNVPPAGSSEWFNLIMVDRWMSAWFALDSSTVLMECGVSKARTISTKELGRWQVRSVCTEFWLIRFFGDADASSD